MSYYINHQGQYIGAFVGVEPPEGSIAVPSAPADARQVWADGWGAIPATVPPVVSRFQALAALHGAGYLQNAEAVIAGAGVVAQLAWNNAQEFRRHSPTVLAIGGALNIDAAGLDALFIAAAQIEA
jgi:hypothetical protein